MHIFWFLCGIFERVLGTFAEDNIHINAEITAQKKLCEIIWIGLYLAYCKRPIKITFGNLRGAVEEYVYWNGGDSTVQQNTMASGRKR